MNLRPDEGFQHFNPGCYSQEQCDGPGSTRLTTEIFNTLYDLLRNGQPYYFHEEQKDDRQELTKCYIEESSVPFIRLGNLNMYRIDASKNALGCNIVIRRT